MWTRAPYRLPGAAAITLLLMLNACGGGGSGSPTPIPTPTPVPSATVTSTGEGFLVLHPSADSRFFFALETPIRVTETTGGTADWNFARISFFRNGRENERFELGADVIERAGFKRINPRSSQLVNVAFRNNDENFDRVDITLGFSDIRDGRQFTVDVPFSSFSGINLSLVPISVPFGGEVKVGTP